MCRSEPRRDDLGWRISNETPLLDPFRTRTTPPKKCEGIGEGIGLRQFQKTADFHGSWALFESSSAEDQDRQRMSADVELAMVQMSLLFSRHNRSLHWSGAVGITSSQHLRIVASRSTRSL